MQSNNTLVIAIVVFLLVSAILFMIAIPTFIKTLKEAVYVDAVLIVLAVLAAAGALFIILRSWFL